MMHSRSAGKGKYDHQTIEPVAWTFRLNTLGTQIVLNLGQDHLVMSRPEAKALVDQLEGVIRSLELDEEEPLPEHWPAVAR